MRLSHLLIALFALALFTADATAGPLQRLRARRSGGCSNGSCVPSYAPPAAHASYLTPSPGVVQAGLGCPGGKCPTR